MKRRVRPDKGKDGKDQHNRNSGTSRSGEDGNAAAGGKDEDGKSVVESSLSRLDDESENQGFGVWLRSTDGVEMMRLFVIANSLLVFVTMAWPNMQEALSVLKDLVMGEEEEE